MFAVVRSDDRHTYGCGEANLGTGDGRLDRLDTGTQDNASSFAGVAYMPTVLAPPFTRLSPQRVVMRHYTPNAGPFLSLNRNIARAGGTTYSLTNGAVVVNNQILPLTQEARTVCDVVELAWSTDTAAGSPEFWQCTVEYVPCAKH